MNKFEAKIKKSLKIEAEQSPDYWESISKKTNIPYNGRMIMKKTTKSNIFRLRYMMPAVCGLALVAIFFFTNAPGKNPSGGDIIGTQTVENLQINNISGSMSAKIRLPENGTTETVSYENYLAQAGMSLNLWLPTGLENTEDAFVYYNEDGTEFMMSGYTFHNPSTGAYLTVRFQKDTLPMTDTRYQLEDQEISTINGEDIIIGYSTELGAYFTTFMYQGIGYEVTGMQGITQDDFISIIQSIIQ